MFDAPLNTCGTCRFYEADLCRIRSHPQPKRHAEKDWCGEWKDGDHHNHAKERSPNIEVGVRAALKRWNKRKSDEPMSLIAARAIEAHRLIKNYGYSSWEHAYGCAQPQGEIQDAAKVALAVQRILSEPEHEGRENK